MREFIFLGLVLGFILGYFTASLVSFKLQSFEYLGMIGVLLVILILFGYVLVVSLLWKTKGRRYV